MEHGVHDERREIVIHQVLRKPAMSNLHVRHLGFRGVVGRGHPAEERQGDGGDCS